MRPDCTILTTGARTRAQLHTLPQTTACYQTPSRSWGLRNSARRIPPIDSAEAIKICFFHVSSKRPSVCNCASDHMFSWFFMCAVLPACRSDDPQAWLPLRDPHEQCVAVSLDPRSGSGAPPRVEQAEQARSSHLPRTSLSFY